METVDAFKAVVVETGNNEPVDINRGLWCGGQKADFLTHKIDDGGIWRTIAGIEYYLARGRPNNPRTKIKALLVPRGVCRFKRRLGEWQKELPSETAKVRPLANIHAL